VSTLTDLTAPYREALNPYLSAGWEGVLPLPPKSKFAPPKGTTGAGGIDPSEETMADWVDRGGNIALRLPKNVIGLDVDSYGNKVGQSTIESLSNKLGDLPATWTSSRHSDLANGRTMLFTVPEIPFKSGAKDVDVLQNSHRYLTAPPSIHPTMAPYLWYAPSGSKVDGIIVPNIDDLSELPEAWVNELKLEQVETSTPAVVLGQVDSWNANLAWLPAGSLCPEEKEKVRYYINGYKTATTRHDWTVKATLSLVWSAAKGHTGIFSALDELRTHFVRLVADDRGIEVAVHEFDSIVSWSVAQVFEKNFGHSEKSDPCKNSKVRTFGKKPYKKYSNFK
jgi:hypothetical protein